MTLTELKLKDREDANRELERALKSEQAMRQSRVINRDYVRRWALDYASTNRCHKFNRVSEQFLNAIEASTKSAIRDRIMRHPSKGKTLQ